MNQELKSLYDEWSRLDMLLSNQKGLPKKLKTDLMKKKKAIGIKIAKLEASE